MALIKCRECGNQVSLDAKSCPQCGAKIKKPMSTLKKIALGLFVLFIIGSIFAPKNKPSQQQATGSADTANVASTASGQSSQENTPSAAQADQNKKPAKPVVNAPSYAEIDHKCKSLTDAQFEEYSKTLVGNTASWTGIVVDVEKNTFGPDFEVRIDMDNTGVQDVYFDVPQSVGMKLTKKSKCTFSGEIDRVCSGPNDISRFGGVAVRVREAIAP